MKSSDLMKILCETVGMADNYESRKVARTEVSGLIVSTCDTVDMGYETAILDKNGAHPVERYDSRASAEAGHSKWCDDAKALTRVRKLGYRDLVDAVEIDLCRRS